MLLENDCRVDGSVADIKVLAVTCVFRYPGSCGDILENVDNIDII